MSFVVDPEDFGYEQLDINEYQLDNRRYCSKLLNFFQEASICLMD
jgi:hypothetical protein